MNWLFGTLISLAVILIPGVLVLIKHSDDDIPTTWFLVGLVSVAAMLNGAVILLAIPLLYLLLASVWFSLLALGVIMLAAYSPYYDKTRNRIPRLIAKLVLVMLVVFTISGVYQYGAAAPVQNAAYFNSLITFAPGNQLFTNSALFPLSHLPIVSEQYALSIANGKLSNWGGSAKIVDSEQIVNGSIPYWLFTVASTNTIGTNHELGYILVSAIDGSDTIIKQTSAVGAGLWWTNNIRWVTYLNNDQLIVGNHYPQIGPGGKIYYVVTKTTQNFDGTVSLGGGSIYTPSGGMVSYAGFASPSWVNQPWDKAEIQTLAQNWGYYRNGNGTFSFFAGGFLTIPASEYKLDVVGSQELVPYGGHSALLVFLSPAGAPKSLDGVLMVTNSTFTYYNFEGYNFISPSYAQGLTEGQFTQRAGGNLTAGAPILYPVNGVYSWIVPSYYYDTHAKITYLWGIGIMNAVNGSNFQWIPSATPISSPTGVTGLLNQAIETFVGSSVFSTINGTVQNLQSYVQNGETTVAVELNNTWYQGTANTMPFDAWVQMLSISAGSKVTIQVSGQTVVGVSAT